MTRRLGSIAALALLTASACGGASTAGRAPSAVASTSGAPRASGPSATATPTPRGAAPSTAAPPAAPPTAGDLLARFATDFGACFAEGKRTTPELGSGKITMHVSVDAEGRTACVIPSDDAGLTQEVEDCVRARIERETYDTRAAWSVELPLSVRDGSFSVRPSLAGTPAALESVETHGMPDAFGVIESMVPRLERCFRGADGRSTARLVYVGARVGATGAVECALTTSARPMPTEMRRCAADVLAATQFPKPRTPVGLISIPIAL